MADKKRERSVAYPSVSLNDAFEITKVIYTNFGRGMYATRDQIAKAFGKSEGTIQTQVSSCVQYGFLEMKVKEGYKPSDLFLRILKPMNDTELKDAWQLALKSPPLYAILIEEFNNNILPNLSALGNKLFWNHGVAEKVSESAASIFIRNIEDMSLLDSEHHLRMGLIDINIPSPRNDQESQVTPLEVVILPNQDNNSNQKSIMPPKENIEPTDNNNQQFNNQNNGQEQSFISYNILLKSKRNATLTIPPDVQKADLDLIIKQLQNMKDSFD